MAAGSVVVDTEFPELEKLSNIKDFTLKHIACRQIRKMDNPNYYLLRRASDNEPIYVIQVDPERQLLEATDAQTNTLIFEATNPIGSHNNSKVSLVNKRSGTLHPCHTTLGYIEPRAKKISDSNSSPYMRVYADFSRLRPILLYSKYSNRTCVTRVVSDADHHCFILRFSQDMTAKDKCLIVAAGIRQYHGLLRAGIQNIAVLDQFGSIIDLVSRLDRNFLVALPPNPSWTNVNPAPPNTRIDQISSLQNFCIEKEGQLWNDFYHQFYSVRTSPDNRVVLIIETIELEQNQILIREVDSLQTLFYFDNIKGFHIDSKVYNSSDREVGYIHKSLRVFLAKDDGPDEIMRARYDEGFHEQMRFKDYRIYPKDATERHKYLAIVSLDSTHDTVDVQIKKYIGTKKFTVEPLWKLLLICQVMRLAFNVYKICNQSTPQYSNVRDFADSII